MCIGSCQAEFVEDPNKSGHGIGSHLAHEAAAMEFDGPLRNFQGVADLFVQHTLHQKGEYLLLSQSQPVVSIL